MRCYDRHAMTNLILLEVAVDLTRSLVAADRYQRLVDAVRKLIPCDAAALLRREGDVLIPLATHGLVPETLGRRFFLREHPRLEIIARSSEPVRFPEDSPLPDPFDGAVSGDDHAHLDVHSCLGCALRVEGELVGVLTVDALKPKAFESLASEDLSLLSALAGAALRTTALLEMTEALAAHHRLVASDLMREKATRVGEMVGHGPAMKRLRSEIDLVASSGLSVLISGETGCGKELVAQAIHDASPRRSGPLIHVNCAALPESLAETELFGHVKGAFSGADKDRPGKFEVAREGTLFLDEVGELPATVQPKLLRALQTGEIQRVGSDRAVTVHTRILAATNRNLDEEVQAGRFRAGLFHRLNGFPLRVPSLRQRREDIPLLVGVFADRARRQLGTGPVRLLPEARQLLQQHDWPGNVRELENAVARILLRASKQVSRGDPVLLGPDLVAAELGKSSPVAEDEIHASLPHKGTLKEQVDAFKRMTIERAYQESSGNWAEAARILGVQRSNLAIAARRLGLKE